MTDINPELYDDNQGEQPAVEIDQLPSFARFIIGDEHGGLDMEGVTGISCSTVHPKMLKLLNEASAMAEKLEVTPDAFLTRLQNQIIACLSGDIARVLFLDHPGEPMPVDEALMKTIIAYSMQNMVLVSESLAIEFDDNPALIAARKMADWIRETHKDDLPFFWNEIEEALHGYENVTAGEVDDAANQ